MTYQELLESGRKMGTPEIDATLRQLSADPRFAAILGWLDLNREACIQEASKHLDGTRAGHAGGALHEINLLNAQLAHLMKPSAKGGMQPPDDVEP